MDEETEGWIKLLSARIDALEQVDAEEEADDKHADSMRLNWIVVGLFAVELVIGGWQLWWAIRHA
ncbi:hypothetical protein WK62_05165 [Burkholderia ubonensis]|uniref:hypothetical protein n=1 Tax=Burkholderia ubonensis TaxID=101571 RepID=UPI00075379C9|nr:hypothetical protein [Burkholderia ubonensis]KVU10655.1 hypothetical protein WK62_05165 [Burkholderia ubonensis]